MAVHILNHDSDVLRTIRIHQIPQNHCRIVEKVAYVEGTFVAVTKSGKFYSNCKRNRWFVAGHTKFAKSALKCLVQLGALTQEEVDKHNKLIAQRDKSTISKLELGYMQEYALKYGIKMTKAQRAKIDKILGEDDA